MIGKFETFLCTDLDNDQSIRESSGDAFLGGFPNTGLTKKILLMMAVVVVIVLRLQTPGGIGRKTESHKSWSQ